MSLRKRLLAYRPWPVHHDNASKGRGIELVSRLFNEEPARPGEPRAPQIEDEVYILMSAFIGEHAEDPNFPQDILRKAKIYTAARQNGAEPPEETESLLAEYWELVRLIHEDSPYSEVRAVVEPTDDSTLPAATLRVFLIATFFNAASTALNQFFSLRMPSIGVGSDVVQLLSMPIGVAMARWLPDWELSLPNVKIRLNPGSFSQKEHLLITIIAMPGYTYLNSVVQLLKLPVFLGEKTLSASLGWQVMIMIASQFLGYGCAGLARHFLVYPPSMLWPGSLAKIALSKALLSDEAMRTVDKHMTRRTFFLITFAAMFVWYWFPNYIIECLSNFNWPTWISPSNVTLAIITGSYCGLGLNPLPTLDWNIATYLTDPIITPLFTILNYAGGFAFAGFVLAPILHFCNVWNMGYLPINANKMFDGTGQKYDVKRILDSNFQFDKQAYEAYSPVWMSTGQAIKICATLTAYMAIVTHMILYYGKGILRGVKAAWERQTAEHLYGDVHNSLMQAYPECPAWWYLVILTVSLLLAFLSAALWQTNLPWWAILVALLLTLVLQIPIGMLKAMTNVSISTAVLAQVIGGYALAGAAIPNILFRMYSFTATSQSLDFLADLKLAHYAKIPPRWVFAAQLYGMLVSGLVSLFVNHWVLDNIEDVCTDHQRDRFSCPNTHSFFVTSILWGVIGPKRLFGPDSPYCAMMYFLPIGVVLTVIAWLATKRWPTSSWRRINVPIILAGPTAWAPYNWSYMQMTVVLALIFNWFIKKRHVRWWERYAYVLSGSFSAAIGIAGLIMFFALQRQDTRVDWVGNSISRAGVDGGRLVGLDGNPVTCANLRVPHGGFGMMPTIDQDMMHTQ